MKFHSDILGTSQNVSEKDLQQIFLNGKDQKNLFSGLFVLESEDGQNLICEPSESAGFVVRYDDASGQAWESDEPLGSREVSDIFLAFLREETHFMGNCSFRKLSPQKMMSLRQKIALILLLGMAVVLIDVLIRFTLKWLQ